MIHDNAWNIYKAKDLKALEKLSEDYKKFLDNGKTERECTELLVDMAEKHGYKNLEDVIAKGEKLGKAARCMP